MSSDRLQPTTFNQMKKYASDNIVEFPAFSNGEPFIAQVKQVSMMLLAKCGKIPNELISAATELFKSDGKAKDETSQIEAMGKMYDLCLVMAEACLVSPTLKEIQDSGIQLTDEQMTAIFNYTQKGVKALKSFRQESTNNVSVDNVETVSDTPVFVD